MDPLQTIENEFLRVSVNRIGAELFSVYDKKQKTEILWQGNPNFWGSRAPVLFPIVGGLKNDTMHYQGANYSIPKHGIIRRNDQLQLIEERPYSITYQLISSEHTLKVYPFRFTFTITFTLNGNALKVEHTVKNEGDEVMYFSLGAHPAFNCPFKNRKELEQYALEFEFDEELNTNRLTFDGLLSDETDRIHTEGNLLRLKENLFDKDALVFKTLKSRKVSLHKKDGRSKVTVVFSDFPQLGIWSKPAAPFICIEPWIGYADKWNTNQNIEDKEGMEVLPANASFKASYSIIVE